MDSATSSGNIIIPPKTYKANPLRLSSKFYFISYSHKDREDVFTTLNGLYNNSVNYWYDIDLDPGDKWNERVKDEIQDEHCIGGIIFLSKNSLNSEAVIKELGMMLEREKESEFRIIPVLVSFTSLDDMMQAFLLDNPQYWRSGKLAVFSELQSNIYITMNNDLPQIVEIASKDGASNKNHLNELAVNLQNLPFSSDGASRKYTLGRYPFEEDGTEKEIEWIAVKNEHDLIYLVSKYCLDFVDCSRIDNTVNDIKETLKEYCFLEDVSLIREEYLPSLPKVFPTDYADSNRRQLLRLYWVLSADGKYNLYNGENIKIKEAIDYSQINAGIRLILQINNRKIGGEKYA